MDKIIKSGFTKTISLLKENYKIRVDYYLTSGQIEAIDRGFAFQRAYRDTIFSPVEYWLYRSDSFDFLLERTKLKSLKHLKGTSDVNEA